MPRPGYTVMVHRDGSVTSREVHVPLWLMRTATIAGGVILVAVAVIVVAYGPIVAAAAREPLLARQVARLLHSSSGAHRLPWHRVINASGGISLPAGSGGGLQRALLEKEGVVFLRGKVSLRRYAWRPTLAE